MANTLKMTEVYAIYALLERGWSRRRIAQSLGIDRETVTRYAPPAAAAPGGAPPGSKPAGSGLYELEPGPNPATAAPPGSAARAVAAPDPSGPPRSSPSRCEPFRVVILAKLDQGLSAKRIHQDLVADREVSQPAAFSAPVGPCGATSCGPPS